MALEGSHRKIHVGIIGYGLSAKVFQIPFIACIPNLVLYSIVQRRPVPGNDATVDHPEVLVYDSVDKLLEDKEVDLVVVTTASHTHYELCKQALNAGKNVLCEKPFTIKTQEADDLIALAKQNRLLLTVFHNRRWDSDFLTLSNLVQNDELGRIVEFESHFDVHAPAAREGWEGTWRTQASTGSGVLYDLGSHLIDQVLQLFGMPSKVTGFLYHQRQGESKYGDPDSMTIILQYPNKMLATLKASVINIEEAPLRYWVRGTKGSFRKSYLDIQESQIVTGGLSPTEMRFGFEPESHHGTLSTISSDGKFISQLLAPAAPLTYKELYNQLARAISGNGNPPVSPESARDVVRIIEIVQESARLERTITVSEYE